MNKATLKQLAVSDKRLTLAILVAILLIILTVWWIVAKTDNHVDLDVDQTINITPQQIQKIEAIGQWEFLAISDEELIDTTRRGIFSDDHLARIYYGTLRIGVDLTKTKQNWIQTRGDSLIAVLPDVGLLDEDFIDEARTSTFYESGKWTAKDREAMYQKAKRLMMRQSLTPENLQSARQQADAHFNQLFRSMGYEHVAVRFETEPQQQ